ncbi:MAG: NUDIX hydrolase [Chloroflexia bacterium]
MPKETWEVLKTTTALHKPPFLKVEMEHVRLPNGREIEEWPIVNARDYVNAVVLNEAGEMMVLEGYKHGIRRSSWQVLGGYLEEGEDPLNAVKRELLEETGYSSNNWQELGSYVVDANRRVGVGHFYLARDARRTAEPDNDDLEQIEIKWVSPNEAQRALHDGRIAAISYALNVALTLLSGLDDASTA